MRKRLTRDSAKQYIWTELNYVDPKRFMLTTVSVIHTKSKQLTSLKGKDENNVNS